MEKIKKVKISRLTREFVEIEFTEVFADKDGNLYVSDKQQKVATSFMNSVSGREALQSSDFDESVKTAVFAMFGDKPTIERRRPETADTSKNDENLQDGV